MSDPGHNDTDAILKALEKRIAAEYRQAVAEIEAKLADYLRRYEKKDDKWQEWVKDGKKTRAEYDKWRVGQIAIGKRWREMKQTLAEDLSNANGIARSIIYGHMPEVYSINHAYGTFEAEKGSMIDTSYTLYNREAVENILKDRKIYPGPGKETLKNIRKGLEVRWNKKQIQSVMIQALLQGESIPNIATRLAKKVGEKNRNSAIRNARTMTTGVEAAGRIDAYKRAEALGVKMEQEWLATHDLRTRHEHRILDGQRRPVGEPFEVDRYKLRYPGDPNAPGFLIYNCRCTVRGIVDGLEPQARKYRSDADLGGMTWEEWKAEKKSKSNPLTLPEEKGNAIKWSYIKKYRTL